MKPKRKLKWLIISSICSVQLQARCTSNFIFSNNTPFSPYPPKPIQTCRCQTHLLCKKCAQGTVYIIISLFRERAAYIVARTWNSSLRVLAPDFLFYCLSRMPVCLERWHISMARDEMSAPAPVLKTTTQEARVTSLASENAGGFFYFTGDIYHIFIILLCHVANSSPPFSPCLLHSLSNPLSRLQVNVCDWTVVFMADFSLCGLCLTVSGETAWCWTLPCCLGWAINGWWQLSRWRHNVGSRTSTAASPCPPGAPPSPTLENSSSEVS